MTHEELLDAHQHLVARSRALRADMSATWLVMDCMLLMLDRAQRDRLDALFAEHRERFMASALQHMSDPSGREIANLEAAIARMAQRLSAVPRSG